MRTRHDGHAEVALVVALLIGVPIAGVVLGASPSLSVALFESPLRVFLTATLLLLAATLWRGDAWLGLFLGYIALRSVTPIPGAFEDALAVACGCAWLVVARRLPPSADALLRWTIGLVGIAEVCKATFQACGASPILGMLYAPPVPAPLLGTMPAWVHGTLGNPNHLGAFLALAAAVAPGCLVPFLVGGIVLSHSALAGIAAGVALALRWRRQLPWGTSILLVGAVVGAVLAARGASPDSLLLRVETWGLGLAILGANAPLTGMGWSSWDLFIPSVQQRMGLSEVWAQAHSALVQLAFEVGIVALLPVWGWVHGWARSMAASPWYPGVLAVGLLASGTFPFRVPAVAVVAIVIVWRATARTEVPVCAR